MGIACNEHDSRASSPVSCCTRYGCRLNSRRVNVVASKNEVINLSCLNDSRPKRQESSIRLDKDLRLCKESHSPLASIAASFNALHFVRLADSTGGPREDQELVLAAVASAVGAVGRHLDPGLGESRCCRFFLSFKRECVLRS